MRKAIQNTLKKFNLECNELVIDQYENTINSIYSEEGFDITHFVNEYGFDRDTLETVIDIIEDNSQ